MQKRSTHKWSRVEIEKAVENVVILNAILGFCRFRKTFRERMQKLCFETVCGSSTRARTSHVPLEWHVKRFTKCNLTSMGERQRSSVIEYARYRCAQSNPRKHEVDTEPRNTNHAPREFQFRVALGRKMPTLSFVGCGHVLMRGCSYCIEMHTCKSSKCAHTTMLWKIEVAGSDAQLEVDIDCAEHNQPTNSRIKRVKPRSSQSSHSDD